MSTLHSGIYRPITIKAHLKNANEYQKYIMQIADCASFRSRVPEMSAADDDAEPAE